MMYTKTFPILLQNIFKLTSNSGASILYFEKEKQAFSCTKQSKLRCRNVLVLNTLLLLFLSVRTVQAKLINHAEFAFCYMVLLGAGINYIGLITSLLSPKESGYAYTQLYRFATKLSNRNGNINKLSSCNIEFVNIGVNYTLVTTGKTHKNINVLDYTGRLMDLWLIYSSFLLKFLFPLCMVTHYCVCPKAFIYPGSVFQGVNGYGVNLAFILIGIFVFYCLDLVTNVLLHYAVVAYFILGENRNKDFKF
jgi:hypothetical protein